MTAQKEAKLHYFELLNDIASGERRAGVHLQSWANKTTDPELKACLSMVADRETSHYQIFKRRIAELGYTWEDTDAPDFEERLRVSGSDMTDVEKIHWGQARQAERKGPSIRDRYETAMADDTVDPLTRSLLRWFSEVESDSGSKLRQVYDRCDAKGG